MDDKRLMIAQRCDAKVEGDQIVFDDGTRLHVAVVKLPTRQKTGFHRSLRMFANAIHEAEGHRAALKHRYGFNDTQIAQAVRALRHKRPLHDLARAFMQAKRKLDRQK